MFTGIVEEVGILKQIKKGAVSATLTLGAEHILNDIHLGDSIAVNGVCLTVTVFTPRSFTADVMHETLRRSALGGLHAGNTVNLERALKADGRFGGHIVSGHIDGTGTIAAIEKDGNAVWFTVCAADSILRYVIEKGSITIDGISLTVAAVHPDSFQVSLIPHTLMHTALSQKHTGDSVNLENDCIGKYMAKFLGLPPSPNSIVPVMSHDKLQGMSRGDSPGVTRDFLAKYGF